MSVFNFLETKPLYYNEIDYNRMPRIYEKIKSNFSKQKIIHIIGTNGKGTTGRFLATALYNKSYKVGHYTSPHISKFNERIWLNGENIDNDTLELAHKKLQGILTLEDSHSLSYFEYTTFLSMLVFYECEFVVLEAGLGGEHDATAVFFKDLTLVTPISYDHEAFLGSDIKSIANEKLNAIQKNAIIAKQSYTEVYDKLEALQEEKECKIFAIHDILKEEDLEKISLISKKLLLVEYLQSNLELSICALKFFNILYEVKDFKNSKLFGRLTSISENIIVDVGHNPLAARAILKALRNETYILVYNTYKDKEYKKILNILKPIISNVEIIQIEDERVIQSDKLQKVLRDLEINYHNFSKINENKKYLVFGSFSVVEEFLKVYNG